jgi:hypothetical protein
MAKIAVAVNTTLNMGQQTYSTAGMARQLRAALEQEVQTFANMNDGVDYTMVATLLGVTAAQAQAVVTVLTNAHNVLAASPDFNLLCDALISAN